MALCNLPRAGLCDDGWLTAFWVHDTGHSEPSQERLLQDAGPAEGQACTRTWAPAEVDRQRAERPADRQPGPRPDLDAWRFLAHILKVTLFRKAPGYLASGWFGAAHRHLGHRWPRHRGRVPGGRKLATTEGCPGRDNPSKEEGAVLGNELVPPSTGGAGGSCSRGDSVGRGPETRGARRPESAHGRGWACVCTSCTEVERWCSLSSSVY